MSKINMPNRDIGRLNAWQTVEIFESGTVYIADGPKEIRLGLLEAERLLDFLKRHERKPRQDNLDLP